MTRAGNDREREQRVREAQEIVRKSIKPGRSLVDELLRERRAEVRRESKKLGAIDRAGLRG